MHSCLLSSFSIFFFFGHRGCSKADRQGAHSCNLPATMPGEAPLEGLAADWIAPRDVISRQHPWITFPGLPCLAACIPPTNQTAELPYGCPLPVFLFFRFSLFSFSFYLNPSQLSPLTISGVCSLRKLFLSRLSGGPTAVRQSSRWAIWLAVSLCLFPCC